MFHIGQQGAVKVVQGEVPLSGENIAIAVKICEPLCKQGQPKLVFDFTNVPLIDSAGLEFLLDLRDHCTKRGGMLVLANTGALIGEILSATGLSKVLASFDDTVAAAGSFAQ